jgi:hypothetical protein
MAEPSQIATRLAEQEAISNQQHNLEEEIRRLLEFGKSLTEGEIRAKPIDEISGGDSITDVIRQALDSIV